MRLLNTGFLLLAACVAGCSERDGDAREAQGAQATPAADAPPTAAPAAPVSGRSSPAPARTATGQLVGASDYRRSAEGNLLDGNAIRSDVAQATLETGRFDLSLLYLAEQTARNRDAQGLTELYARRIREQLAATPQAQLDILQCGDTLCLGRIRTDDPAVFPQWFARFDKDPGTPHYAWMETLVHMNSGVLEHRFVFSTDPSVSSLRASTQTRSQR